MTSAPSLRRAAIFLDKDGTVLEDLPWNVDPDRMRLAPTTPAALAVLGALGLPLVVVSNQSGVALRKFPESALDDVRLRLAQLFERCGARLHGFLWCPHAPGNDGRPVCACRKPQPGLLRQAADRFDVDLPDSWMVGDILDDVEAGQRAGCRTILVDVGNETVWRTGPHRDPHHRVQDLVSAARVIATARAQAPSAADARGPS
jgi:D-glycero-D-manno-heptose 1,7-bisphosphate phosphatase